MPPNIQSESIKLIKSIPILNVAHDLKIKVIKTKAKCINPHHNDENPSLSFKPEKNIFKCFSCGIGGDVIKLVEIANGTDFKGALDWFARNYSIYSTNYKSTQKNPLRKNHATHESIAKKSSLRAPLSSPLASRLASPLKQKNSRGNGLEESDKLPSNHSLRSEVYDFLLSLCSYREAYCYLKKRGINDKGLVIQFGIKCLQEKKETIEKTMERFGIKALVHAGLFKKGRFVFEKHRLLIPYFQTIKGKKIITSIQGRNIDSDEKPKYRFNHDAKTTLYNVDALSQPNIKRVCLVEGVLDVLSFYVLRLWDRYGLPIGVPGVHAFKDEYLPLFNGLEVTAIGDNDNAGFAFLDRVRKSFLNHYHPITIATTPNKKLKDINDMLKATSPLS